MIRIFVHTLFIICLTFCVQKKNTAEPHEQSDLSDTNNEKPSQVEKLVADNSEETISMSKSNSEDEPKLNLQKLQGIWYSEPDLNFSYNIDIIQGNNILAVYCLEGICENDEEMGMENLFFCESYIGFNDEINSNFKVDDLKISGKYLVTIGKTFSEKIGFDDLYDYNTRLKLLTTSVSTWGGNMKDEDGSIKRSNFFKYDTIPQDLRRSLIKISEKEGRDYIKEYGL